MIPKTCHALIGALLFFSAFHYAFSGTAKNSPATCTDDSTKQCVTFNDGDTGKTYKNHPQDDDQRIIWGINGPNPWVTDYSPTTVKLVTNGASPNCKAIETIKPLNQAGSIITIALNQNSALWLDIKSPLGETRRPVAQGWQLRSDGKSDVVYLEADANGDPIDPFDYFIEFAVDKKSNLKRYRVEAFPPKDPTNQNPDFVACQCERPQTPLTPAQSSLNLSEACPNHKTGYVEGQSGEGNEPIH